MSVPNADTTRAEVRAFLSEHLTERHRGLRFTGEPDRDWLVRMREWNAVLAEGRWAAPSWPVRWGGRGAGLVEQVVVAEEMDAAAAPAPLNALGIPNIAPAIMAHGSEDQQERYLLPLLRGEEIWCQGFSEPDAGSDLASLRCRAVPDGDHWVVSGQKVWTTWGQLADHCELLVRTDPRAARPHNGITCLLVDMSLPGITVSPLRTMAGTAEFNEILFDEVRVPMSCQLGEVNAGWSVAMSTLSNERSGVAALHLALRRRIDQLIGEVQLREGSADPLARQALARLHAEGEILRLLAARVVAAAAAGKPPGSEASVITLAWSRLGQRLPDAATRLLGVGTVATDNGDLGGTTSDWGRDLVSSCSLSIAGGTTEVNRNIVAERVLGLPRS